MASSRIPPTARISRTVSEGTPHTQVVWAKSARPIACVCCIAVLGYAVKVAGLFVSLPRTRYLSFSFPPFNIMHVFLSLSLHLFLSFFFFQMLTSSVFLFASILLHSPLLVLVVSSPLPMIRSPCTSRCVLMTTSPLPQAQA